MSMFTLAFSCLTTPSLPWFMDLTFQVPMWYCCLLHQTFLQLPAISTTECYFCFGSISSFFLELFLHWSPVACWTPTNLGGLSFTILSFAFSYCSWGSQGKNNEVVCHSFLQSLANRVLPRECTGHSKHPLPTTHEKTLHMDITKQSILKSDWLYSLQSKMEKVYTVSKNKTDSWPWLKSWTPYCQIQTSIEESGENH